MQRVSVQIKDRGLAPSSTWNIARKVLPTPVPCSHVYRLPQLKWIRQK